jgi:hypothetical protein
MSDTLLAALAMRERAAEKLSEIIDGWEVIRKYHEPGSFSGDAAVKSIRTLPTTFTDEELLAAVMQLPEVRALVSALNHAQYGLSWAVRYFKDQDVTRDDPCPPCTRGLSATRAALAPFMKGGE